MTARPFLNRSTPTIFPFTGLSSARAGDCTIKTMSPMAIARVVRMGEPFRGERNTSHDKRTRRCRQLSVKDVTIALPTQRGVYNGSVDPYRRGRHGERDATGGARGEGEVVSA